MTDNTCRETFEKEFNIPSGIWNGKGYPCDDMHHAYKGWQAAWNHKNTPSKPLDEAQIATANERVNTEDTPDYGGQSFDEWFKDAILPCTEDHKYYTKESLEWAWNAATRNNDKLLREALAVIGHLAASAEDNMNEADVMLTKLQTALEVNNDKRL